MPRESSGDDACLSSSTRGVRSSYGALAATKRSDHTRKDSSIGRASDYESEGYGFDPRSLHQNLVWILGCREFLGDIIQWQDAGFQLQSCGFKSCCPRHATVAQQAGGARMRVWTVRVRIPPVVPSRRSPTGRRRHAQDVNSVSSNLTVGTNRPCSPTAEATVSNAVQCPFESDQGHSRNGLVAQWESAAFARRMLGVRVPSGPPVVIGTQVRPLARGNG